MSWRPDKSSDSSGGAHLHVVSFLSCRPHSRQLHVGSKLLQVVVRAQSDPRSACVHPSNFGDLAQRAFCFSKKTDDRRSKRVIRTLDSFVLISPCELPSVQFSYLQLISQTSFRNICLLFLLLSIPFIFFSWELSHHICLILSRPYVSFLQKIRGD